ncbi:MAG: response regulator [Siphonobacter sp.]
MQNNDLLNILLADDDLDDRFLWQEAFLEAGCNINWEEVDSESALVGRLLQREQKLPNLLLLDWNLRPGGGPDLLKFIRTNSALRSLPIIIMSTSSVPEEIESAYYNGANSYLIKPASYNDLVVASSSLYDFWYNIAQLPTC